MAKASSSIDLRPAKEASKIADNYLSFTESGGLDIGYTGDANAHGKTNIKADGMRIYDSDDAVNPVARFTVNGGQIGKDGESRLVLNSDGQTLINDNIVWFGVNKSGNPTVDDVPTQESFASNTAQNPSVTLKNTPNGRISVITQGQYMWLGSTYYTSRIEDTFTYGRTSSESHSERIEVTTSASVTWTVTYDGNKTITISNSSHSGTATHRIIVQTVTYTVGAGTAVDLGIMTFGSTREKPTGNGSVLLGRGLASEGNGQVVLGRYNKPDKNNDNALIIGNGSSSSYTNAFSVAWDGDLTAAGGLTLHNHSSTVGTIKDAFRNVNQNLASGKWLTVCSLSLEAGVWLIKCNVTFSDITSAGGTYAIGLTTSSSGEPWNSFIVGPSATTTADKNVQYTQIVTPTATWTYYLRARQSSGELGSIQAGAAGGKNSMRAVRII